MSKIGLIISREFNQRVRKKSFIITTLLMPFAFIAMIAVPVLIQLYGGDSSAKEIIVVESEGILSSRLHSGDNITFVTTEESYPEVTKTHPDVYGYLVIGEGVVADPSNVRLYTTKASTIAVETSITRHLSEIITQIRIENSNVEGLDTLINAVRAKVSMLTFDLEKSDSGELSETASSSGVAMAVAYVSSFIIYFFIFLYGTQVLTGVVEEKANRIVEVIVSSVKPFELMMGKILGVALVAILQFLVWVVIIGVAVAFLPSLAGGADMSAMAEGAQMAGNTGAMMSPKMMGVLTTLADPMFITRILGSFMLYFVGGYLLYASMFAAVGSAVDNVGDSQQLQLPITLPLVIAIFVMVSAMQSPHSDLVFWCSMIPFTSPIIMMARVAYGVPVWEFVLSIVILYGTFVAFTFLAAKIYRVGIFMYGKKPSFFELLKWITYKG